jgi:hypothetical protein
MTVNLLDYCSCNSKKFFYPELDRVISLTQEVFFAEPLPSFQSVLFKPRLCEEVRITLLPPPSKQFMLIYLEPATYPPLWEASGYLSRCSLKRINFYFRRRNRTLSYYNPCRLWQWVWVEQCPSLRGYSGLFWGQLHCYCVDAGCTSGHFNTALAALCHNPGGQLPGHGK